MSRIEAPKASRKKASTLNRPVAKPSPKKAKRLPDGQEKAHSRSNASQPLKVHGQGMMAPSGVAAMNGAPIPSVQLIWEGARELLDAGQKAIADGGRFLQNLGFTASAGASVETQSNDTLGRSGGAGEAKLESGPLMPHEEARKNFNRYLKDVFDVSDWTALANELGHLGFLKLSSKGGHIRSSRSYGKLSFSEKSISPTLGGTLLSNRDDSTPEGVWMVEYRKLMEKYPKMGSVTGFINKLVEEGHLEGLKSLGDDVIRFKSKPGSHRMVAL